ncbi:MAG: TetR/AcrR family transcriptional regulator [Oscillospiraceae bacterium]|nr:TetR/AcrR family transcriptional regulator [Oscillospiraceae bacterium]
MDQRNARADRSKAMLKTAFLELFRSKEPEKITVVELCRKAGLNRSTFYAHYDYMDELIREVLLESVEKVFAGLGPQWDLPLEDGGVDRAFIASYLKRFLNDPTVRRFCSCENSENYRTLLIRAHVDLTLGPSKDSTVYYTAYFHNSGVLNLLLEWLNKGMQIPEQTVVEIIHEFSKVMYRSRS